MPAGTGLSAARARHWPRVFAVAGLLAAGCGGGGDGGTAEPGPPPVQNCNSTSVFQNGACRTFAVRIDERAPTPFTEAGAAVTLEVVLFKPLQDGRYPALMFNHGSTGNGSDPSQFTLTYTNKAIAQFFVERGFIVAFPQRRGRGQSGGTYDEGFNDDRSAYSCDSAPALAGAERALADLDAAVDWLRDRADVDTTQLYVGGTSRGGILSLVHAASRPDIYGGAINFVGGWLGEPCGDYDEVNKNLFIRAAANPGPTIWIYGRNDSFYSIDYSRSNYDAFVAAGGYGAFHEFARAAGLDGHFIANDPALWGAVMEAFLEAP